MHHFTPSRALIGGALLGMSASALWLWSGRVAGISGMVSGLLSRASPAAERAWQGLFLAGLVVGGLLLRVFSPSVFAAPDRSLPVIAVAGLMVGLGARLGGGCTSGHGICGLSRLSLRSLVAVATFIATGIAIVLVGRGLGLGQ